MTITISQKKYKDMMRIVEWAARLGCACGTVDGVPQPKGNCIGDVAKAFLLRRS